MKNRDTDTIPPIFWQSHLASPTSTSRPLESCTTVPSEIRSDRYFDSMEHRANPFLAIATPRVESHSHRRPDWRAYLGRNYILRHKIDVDLGATKLGGSYRETREDCYSYNHFKFKFRGK
ncbi:hypothetical protein LXL04_038865 [Taraxacum kok-saghyz]